MSESWLSSLLWISWRTSQPKKPEIGILAYEAVSLMSKVVKLWHGLSDWEILRLKEEITKSIGIKMFVSEEDEYLMNLALDEIIETVVYVARSVIRLGKRCADPVYHRLDRFFNDPIGNGFEWSGWAYRWKKMERKVKKMERFMGVMLQLSQEQEVLAEYEQTLRRMKANPNMDRAKLYEFQQKVQWQRQQVKHLQDSSPWSRSYDYIVRLLARSIFTILEKMTYVFGLPQGEGLDNMDSPYSSRTASTPSSVYPSECIGIGYRFNSGHLGRSLLRSSSIVDRNRTHAKQEPSHYQSSSSGEKPGSSVTKRLADISTLTGCVGGGFNSPIANHYMLLPLPIRATDVSVIDANEVEQFGAGFASMSDKILSKLALFYSKCGCLTAPRDTLGEAGLALHYANVILMIEKLAPSPHLIGLDAREDLYNMLPASIRMVLRAKLGVSSRGSEVPVGDANSVEQSQVALVQMLECLYPLAHNTVNWQSERNIEKQHDAAGGNVLLVQTLYFANQAKIEAAIVKLLVNLNSVYQIKRKFNEKT